MQLDVVVQTMLADKMLLVVSFSPVKMIERVKKMRHVVFQDNLNVLQGSSAQALEEMQCVSCQERHPVLNQDNLAQQMRIVVISLIITLFAIKIVKSALEDKMQTMNNKILIIIIIGIFAFALGGVLSRGPLYTPRTDNQGLMTNLSQTNENDTYLKLARVNKDFYNEMQTTGPYTLFVPTDQAFAKLPKSKITNLQKSDADDSWDRTNLLAAHMVIGNHPSTSLYDGMTLDTVQGKKITLTKKGNDWYIDGTIRVLQTNIVSQNGIIYIIDGVITPMPY